jgi:hypothetical protein
MNIKRQHINVTDRHSLVQFIQSLANDVTSHPEQWENRDLGAYLEAMAGWLEDMDGYYINKKLPVPDVPSWSLIADILLAAKVYE